MIRLFLISLCLFTGFNAKASSTEQRGLQIITEVHDRDSGWHDIKSDMTMLLRNMHGDESLRHMHTQSLELDKDGDKTLIVFDQPLDVKGTALLSYSHKVDADDQWLYLPALKRVKRIASKNKSGPFMGSEFAYEDLASQEIEKFSYQYIRDEQLDDRETFIIERIPVDNDSGYSYQRVWIDKERYIPLKVEYYDRKRTLLKTLSFRGYRQYLDHYWRSDEMYMENQQTGKSTLLTWKQYEFHTGLDEDDFNSNSLKRVH